MIRQPICVFMGHIDHGKTSIADALRHTAVAKTEAGAITQMISSSLISIDTIRKVCSHLISPNLKFTIPGLLLIDTPGHAAFTNLRKRGGNLADIAVLAIDINEGLMAQTLECIDILKQYKTPFVIALNKIDLVNGFRASPGKLSEVMASQQEPVRNDIDQKLYEIVGKLYDMGFQADRYDRISDYTSQVAIVPCSAKSGLGIAELLLVIIGLAQKYLEKKLTIVEGAGKGTVLEVKEEKGVGTILDMILYDGTMKQGDTIVIGNIGEPIVTTVRGIFLPERGKMKSVKEVSAAAGIRVSAPDLDGVISGVPVMVVSDNLGEAKQAVQEEVDEVTTEVDNEGVVIKAESLGSLEALARLLKEKNIPVKKASVGEITKKDMADATAELNDLHKAILAFNINAIDTQEVKIISHDVIYHIIEDYEKWVAEETRKTEEKSVEALIRPAKVQIIPGCIFRQSNPAVVGVMVLGGVLKQGVDLIKADGSKVAVLKSMQVEKETVEKAEKGKEVAIALPGIIAGRQIDENDILYVDMPESNFKELKEFRKFLKPDEINILKEFSEIKRKENKFWGI